MEKKREISSQPPKGTVDWLPSEFRLRKYIFDTWRQVCTSFGYEEYLTPLVESADVYRAKSGEDVGGKELVTFNDLGGRELSIRPEMTPSVTRVVSNMYRSAQKPIRLFSIANFMRNEKPQRGRNREFWQLNFDIFGTEERLADLEILQMALECMLAFNPPAGSFTLFVNNRKLIDTVLDMAEVPLEIRSSVVRTLDKWAKMDRSDIDATLSQKGVGEEGIKILANLMESQSVDDLKRALPDVVGSEAYTETEWFLVQLEELGYGPWIAFGPNIIRGFDYYDGMVFEVFDNNPDNTRSMFGGGRYNGLAEIFGGGSFPAVGCAPGDETTYLFLQSWGLFEGIGSEDKLQRAYLPLLPGIEGIELLNLAKELRMSGTSVVVGVKEQSVSQALEYADKGEFASVILYGSEEKNRGVYKTKDLVSGVETEVPRDSFL